jgi:hypothetical protein
MNRTYEWQLPYEAAILETDRSRLPKLIAEAQAAIDARIANLRPFSDGHAGAKDGHAGGKDGHAGAKDGHAGAKDGHAGNKMDGEAQYVFEEKEAIADALAGIRILIREIS